MKAGYITKPRTLTIGDFSEPKVGPDEVLLRIATTGMCGSDVEVYNGIYPEMRYPVIMGHETSGTIAQVGENLKGEFEIGERVTCEPSWGCGKCYFCKGSKDFYNTSNHCIDPRRLGRSANGSYAEFTVVPAKVVYRLPENVTHEQAQSTTTLSCVIHGFRKSNLVVDSTVAILGTGHAALLAQQVAKAFGAGQVIVVGRNDNKLRLSRQLGSDVTIDTKSEDPVRRLMELTDDIGPDLVIEATGAQEMFKIGMSTVKPAGRMMQFGIVAPPGKFELEAVRLMYKEIELIGTCSGRGCYPIALRLISKGKVKIDPLITHHFNLVDLEKGIEVMENRIGNPTRVLISSQQKN